MHVSEIRESLHGSLTRGRGPHGCRSRFVARDEASRKQAIETRSPGCVRGVVVLTLRGRPVTIGGRAYILGCEC